MGDESGGRDAVKSGHAHIEQDEGGRVLGHELDRLFARTRLADDPETWDGLDDRAGRTAKYRRVIDDQDGDIAPEVVVATYWCSSSGQLGPWQLPRRSTLRCGSQRRVRLEGVGDPLACGVYCRGDRQRFGERVLEYQQFGDEVVGVRML